MTQRPIKPQRTYQARIHDPDGTLDTVLGAYADLYGQAERTLFADLVRGGDPAALKSDYMRRFGLTARQFNGKTSDQVEVIIHSVAIIHQIRLDPAETFLLISTQPSPLSFETLDDLVDMPVQDLSECGFYLDLNLLLVCVEPFSGIPEIPGHMNNVEDLGDLIADTRCRSLAVSDAYPTE